MTLSELDDLIKKLPTGKSSGYDSIPNEFLINSSLQFRQYLKIFYNKIIDEGKVPEALNLGKCLLLHKVNITIFGLKWVIKSKGFNFMYTNIVDLKNSLTNTRIK